MKTGIISTIFNNGIINNLGRYPWIFQSYREDFKKMMQNADYIITDPSTSEARKELLSYCERPIEIVNGNSIEMLNTLKKIGGKKTFIFGNKNLYKSSLEFIDTIILTIINNMGHEGALQIDKTKQKYQNRKGGKLMEKVYERDLGEKVGTRFPINYTNKNIWKQKGEPVVKRADLSYFLRFERK